MRCPDHTRRSLLLTAGVCSHAGCSMVGWLKAEQGDKGLECFCHNSEFNPPWETALVVFGPPAPASGGTIGAAHRS